MMHLSYRTWQHKHNPPDVPPISQRQKLFAAPPAEQGQGLVEYALILVLVAVVVILALTIFGDSVQAQYCSLTHQLSPEADISSACVTPIIIPSLLDSGPNYINLEARIYDPDGDQSNPYGAIVKVDFYLNDTSNLIISEGQYRYCLGTGNSSCGNYNISSLPAGRHAIIILAYDTDGNVGRKTYYFTK